MLSRSITSRASTRVPTFRGAQICSRRTFADAPKPQQGSNRLPWIVLGLGLVGGGAYYTLVPTENKQQVKQQVHDVKEQAKGNIEAHKREIERETGRRPKPNPDKASEEGHAKASENNEHKVRHGVFSAGKEFDNHDTKHTLDPAKDFETLKK